ncbi:aldehyde dehydrogenase [NAD(P)+] 1 [Trichomonascus vanleenenianus]|uniref:aldehyde dehydrogenase [NAD(P)+] 1 n=1 Tax=Trichomonascus vanleenenianus TaxID=2268995 RepID=UPI003ECA4400
MSPSSLPLSQEIALPNGVKYTQPLGLFINNEFVPAKSGNRVETINPATEEPICEVHAAGAADVDAAVDAARAAFPKWKRVSGAERGALMQRLVRLIYEERDLLSAIDALDAGKPRLKNVMNDVEESLSVFSYYAGWADKLTGKAIECSPDKFAYTRHEPYGVCGQIVPWNYPLGMASWKIAPAVAAGNVIVLKTSEVTPLSMLYFGKLVQKAGFPPGVINIISGFGRDAGAALAAHMDVDKIAFTGSTLTGRAVMKAAAESNMKAVTLECGGKSPNLVFADSDFEQAVKWSLFGIMYNMGQVCSATSRIYVEETIYDKFVEAIKQESLATARIGDPFDDSVEHGPQVNEAQYKKVLRYIEIGKKEGARLILGGGTPAATTKGYYVEPTIFADVTEDMTIMKEEIFGPVVCISKFSTEKEAIRKANNSEYGLGAAVFTTNLNRAHRVAAEIESGTVWINSSNDCDVNLPFGGFKQSGIGSELGEYGINTYTQVKAVHVNLGTRL